MRDSFLIVVHEVDVYMHQNTAPVRLVTDLQYLVTFFMNTYYNDFGTA